jgi:hypothetical protein
MCKRATVGVILFLICLWPLRGHGWEGKQDNKAAENLAQMKDRELCTEAQAVCARAAVPGAGMAMEGLDYLATIRLAVQQKHGQADPIWLTDAVTAITKHTPQHCPHACVWRQAKKRRARSSAAGESPPSQEHAPSP